MSLLSTPLWQDLGGNPRTGVIPPTLTVRSGRLTPQRHAEIEQIYLRFCMAKLAAVGEFFVFNRVLTDGTRVRMESLQGRDRVMVWASDADQGAKQWEYGWCLVPADAQSLKGYVRRAGTSGSLLRQDFRAPTGQDVDPKVFTFVDGRTGKRHVGDSRVGGNRVWRGPPDKALVLTYEGDTVYVAGKKTKLDFFGSEGFTTGIDGAAIALRGQEPWLVIITQSAKRTGLVVGAIRVKDLKAVNREYVECGPAVVPSGDANMPIVAWNFSPDGLKAIALGGVPVLGGNIPGSLNLIYRVELTPINGTTPFSVKRSTQEQQDIGVTRVGSSFNPEAATRNLHWEGWRDFYARLARNYYAAYHHQAEGQFGQERDYQEKDTWNINPTIVAEGAGDTPFQAPVFYDPILSVVTFATKGGQDNIPFFSDQDTQEISTQAPVVIPKAAFLFDDGDVPDSGIHYTRELVRDEDRPGQNVTLPPPLDENQVAVRPEGAGGWFVQSYRATNWIKNIFEYSLEPQKVRCKVRLIGLVVKYVMPRVPTPTFDSLQQLASHFDMRWSDVAFSSASLGTSINGYYGALVAKSDYPRLTDAARYLSGLADNLMDRHQQRDLVNDTVGVGAHRVFNLRGSEFEAGDSVPEYGSNEYEIGGVYYRTSPGFRYAESNTTGQYKPFGLKADFYATPKFKNHYTTSWHFSCQVALTGRCLLAAGYDRQGQERFIYFEGDEARTLRYTASVLADDEAIPQRSVAYSGELGCVLKVGSQVVGQTSYAVADAFGGPLEEHDARWWTHSGTGPAITVKNLIVYDLDVALGHVLCREVREVFSATGEPAQARPTQYELAIKDFLHTPTAVHELGQGRSYADGARVLDEAVRYFASTAAMFGKTCLHFIPDGQLEVGPSHFLRDGPANQFYAALLPLVPSSQRNPAANAYGWNDSNFETVWARDALFLYPGRDGRTFHYTGTVLHMNVYTQLELAMKPAGAHAVPPRATLQLRSFSDDAWMVCYCQEQYTAVADKPTTQARYFIKCGKKSPVTEVDAAAAFPFLLADSPSLQRVGFYFGAKP